ncbi:MAG: plasmid stabilization system protein [Parcubacteria group bacterium GW2011_GWA2_50_10b]|nr:MAG: plasmid stabilization system protein [Parcubacteria group bacterium GW2011_GWA2_50_10b]
MAWEIGFSKQAEKFLKQHHLSDREMVAINIKRLSGKWEGCFRIRLGKNRIIFSINFERQTVLIEVVDNRGGVYR